MKLLWLHVILFKAISITHHPIRAFQATRHTLKSEDDFVDFLTLEDRTDRLLESSVRIYRHTLRNN